MVVKVYGRYKPGESERRERERIAGLQDAGGEACKRPAKSLT